MSADPFLIRFLARFPAVSLAVYGVLVSALLVVTWSALADIYNRRSDVAAAEGLLDQLEGRRSVVAGNPTAGAGPVPAGPPFLQGKTVTVAGAALLQRVASAVSHVGGSMLSSQVDLLGPQAKDDYISVLASCELQQPALQQLLYDIEAGMPFLFVNQLNIQAPNVEGAPLRVLLTVSGRWEGAK